MINVRNISQQQNRNRFLLSGMTPTEGSLINYTSTPSFLNVSFQVGTLVSFRPKSFVFVLKYLLRYVRIIFSIL